MKIVRDQREVLAETKNGKVTVSAKLPLKHCKKILNSNGRNYTDEQIILIRDFLYAMATLDYLYFTEHLKADTLTKPENEKESDTLHQSEYRRAS